MRFKKLLVIGTAAVAVVASVTGAALASGSGRKAPTKPAASAVATDSASTRVKTADENPGGGENSGEGENTGESDGPGGHQDPAGQDVNHEFSGQE